MLAERARHTHTHTYIRTHARICTHTAAPVRVLCYDSNNWSSDDLIGDAALSVELLCTVSHELILSNDRGKEVGSIVIRDVNITHTQAQVFKLMMSDTGSLLQSAEMRKRVRKRDLLFGILRHNIISANFICVPTILSLIRLFISNR